ncbi:MAG: type II toxin-antitoxin system RelE/ParE family toxin [Flavobacterium sp.]|jgi:plasmid stabilization system protein ParE|uniref:type II toxin-antitoxin system RelE/ParE family toxin n=1 Tax=Flavobacterium sp. TaxID=239 RepID=UPI0022C6381F|nr:type II toxin-antitoxin system RelE/ParE family toxin [Flavobacterium sp.]MCZ8196040.1 type II toxin-antitoxin system RelE/ParE family toxin [Flavobacterium sp.]
MKIVWSIFATKQLKKIRESYSQNTISNIIIRTKALKEFPFIGQKEELLNFRNEDFRYLIEGKFKIIYCVDKETIRIYSVFHTKQNPEKIKNLD